MELPGPSIARYDGNSHPCRVGWSEHKRVKKIGSMEKYNKIQMRDYSKKSTYIYVVHNTHTSVPYLGLIPDSPAEKFGQGIFYFLKNNWNGAWFPHCTFRYHINSSRLSKTKINKLIGDFK